VKFCRWILKFASVFRVEVNLHVPFERQTRILVRSEGNKGNRGTIELTSKI
jgi:hypothetical protein